MSPKAVFLALTFLVLAAPVHAVNGILGPPDLDGPVVVDIGLFLSNINGISEEDETIDFEAILRMRWNDPRLVFDPAVEGVDQLYYQGDFQFNEVFEGWWPQIVLVNEASRYERQGVSLAVKPDGTVFYTEEFDAKAKSRMQLRRFPFDEQHFIAMFEVLGMDKKQLVFRADPATSGLWRTEHHEVRVPQWREPRLSTRVIEYDPAYADGHDDPVMAFVVDIDIERDPIYMLRLVILPVMMFVILSWSVFWMDRSSVGDRMDITFIAILTIVAYQIMSSQSLPKISYMTVLMSFMTISFLMMCASVLVNLRVAYHDKHGRSELGDRMDVRCRILFPLIYVLSTLLVGGYYYLVV